MLLDQGDFITSDADEFLGDCGYRAALPRWTVVLPFHNERDFLPVSLRSLAVQSVPFQLILVDNGSTDGSAEIAMDLCRHIGLAATLLTERRPGKVSALQTGVGKVVTELVATCDADTIYPHDYLARAARLLDQTDTVAAVAATAPPESSEIDRRMAGLHIELASRVLRQQCLNGGAGQVFRTLALKAAGGFDPLRWNWVLEDHEIMARIEQKGRIAYDRGFLCMPISRPRSVNTVGWNLLERLRYHVSTPSGRQKFFHTFLGPRLRNRALTSDRLRRDAGYCKEPQELTSLYPVRG